jgi:filamentous hemagglutinin family protein
MSRRPSRRRSFSRDLRLLQKNPAMPHPKRSLSRGALLAGTSLLTLLLTAPDIASARQLGSGGAVTSATNFASDAATLAAQQAAATAKQSSAALLRATQAIQAMQSVQNAARAAAQASQSSTTLPQVSVANGLAPGGLVPDSGLAGNGVANPVTSWTGATTPTQSVDASGQTQVGIQQTAAQAILNWSSFNVGARTTLTFDQQGNANWVALNRVAASTAPSQILGNINAVGQVYVINQNGIIFGGASQINVGSLIASTAGITDQQFLTNGIYSTQTGSTYNPSFTGAGGKIIVEQGALITTNAPASVTSGGGFVLLMGTEVDNAGSISTPNGQTELAAGDDFILRPGVGTNANQTSTTRGNEIAPVLHANSTSGTVDNTGLVFSQQGDITLAGHAIVQDGILVSTTSVNQRGTIHLLNSASDASGSVTLTGNALTLILPELDSTDTALDSQRDALIADSATQNIARAGAANAQFDNLSLLADREDQSRVEIVTGGTVDFQNGSLTMAQGGQVAVSAGQRVFTETGSIIDVSGSNAAPLPMSDNEIQVNVQGNELRDSPANRDSGALLNANIWIDVRDLILVPAGTGGYATDRYYTPGGLLEVSGYLSNMPHTIGEWTAVGGTITLSAPEVVAQQGSTFNISGGSVSYAGGDILSTNLRGSDGHIYSADDAPADMTFIGLAGGFMRTHNINGQLDPSLTEIWSDPFGKGSVSSHYEDGYTVGRDAGSLILSTPTSVFEGDIVADVITGQRQTDARPAGVTDGYKLTQDTAPLAGTLALGQYNANGLFGAYSTDVVFGSDIVGVANGVSVNGALPGNVANTAYFSASDINSSGLGGLSVATRDQINVDAPLTLAPGAQVKLIAPVVDIKADVTAPSGGVTVTNILQPDLAAAGATVLTTPAGLALLTLESGATIDTRGLWVDALLDPNDTSGLAFLNGGNVTFDSTQGVTLAAGSTIDVSSGAAILANGKTQGGKGGNVTLVTDDPSAGATGATSAAPLALGATIRAVGVNGGGTLKLAANGVLIAPAGTATAAGQVLLTPDFFATGFSNYDINGYGGVIAASGTTVDVVMPVYRFNDASFATPTGIPSSSALQVWLPPEYLEDPLHAQLTQRAGASIALRSMTVAGGSTSGAAIDVGQGTAITVDPGQSITLDAFGQITVDGALTAHSGTIRIINEAGINSQAGRNFDAAGDLLGRSIWIGSNAVLDVSSEVFTAFDLSGRSYGTVGDGGSIQIGGAGGSNPVDGTVLSTTSFIVIRPGAVLDASGASALIDPNAGTDTATLGSPFTLAGNGGSIALDSYSGIYNDGTLVAAAGGAAAAGGSLSITLETPAYPNNIGSVPIAAQMPSIITVTQGPQPSGLPSNLAPGMDPSALKFGHANVSADAIAAGGFDNVSLYARDAILFVGDVKLSAGQSIKFFQGTLADTVADGHVTIMAPYVSFDGHTSIKADNTTFPSLSAWAPSTTSTQAIFDVDADLIDFQNDVLFGINGQVAGTGYDFLGFHDVNFVSQGDIRFLGPTANSAGTAIATRVLTPGNFSFTAAQLYPTTGATAVIAAGVSDSSTVAPESTSSITVSRISDVDPGLPESVFGKLSLAANSIYQGGIIRAPLGLIGLGGASFSAVGSISVTSNLVQLRPGSITSVSANGLEMPYGGTTDGLTYSYNGTAVNPQLFPVDVFGNISSGIVLAGNAVDVQSGAVLDLSGGGNLAGHGFISGRGGSIDVLTTPLVNANPGNTFSSSGNKVYAIMPSYGSAYAPVSAENGAGDPMIGQRITIPAGVPGLAAGTYTLLPSTYALLPGAYRVELGANIQPGRAGAVAAVGNGTYAVAGTTSVANTAVRSALQTEILVTSADAVRKYSQYDEQSYTDFLVTSAAQFGKPRPIIPLDAKTLMFSLSSSNPSLTFGGTTLFQPATDSESGVAGFGGTAIISGGNIEVYSSVTGPTAGFGGLSVDVADLNAIGASRLIVGGFEYLLDGTSEIHVATTAPDQIYLRNGVTLSAGEVVLAGGGITLDPGATISTIGKGPAPFDSSNGFVYAADTAALVLSNGDLNFINSGGTGAITIGAGAAIYSEGTIVFATNGATNIDAGARYGSRSLQLAVSNINIGDGASMGATVPSGLAFDQALFDRLVAGAGAGAPAGVPALEKLVLSAGNSVNFYGTVGLDASGTDIELVLNTPAIYGYGAATDHASLTAGTLVWTGVSGATLPAIAANGAGTGLGTLDISAATIILGISDLALPNNQTTLDRVTYGFSTVNLTATDQIISNNKGTLSVYQAPSTASDAVFGKSGIDGTLNLTTPLLTGAAGSVMSYTAGGALNVTAPAGATATPQPGNLGAEIDLAGDSVSIATAVVLPSGKLVVNATNDITIGTGGWLDLSGQPTTIVDATVYGFGGDISLSSVQGNITQQAGSVIDVSATGNDAGSLTVSAIGTSGGRVSLGGELLGGSTPVAGDTTSHADGSFTVAAQTLASGNPANLSSDFAVLNQTLTNGGFFASRSFDLRQGNLTIGNDVKAHSVSVSVDGGSLTVNGTIDASGAAPGSIRLSARDDLELTSSGKLDAHGTQLLVDSNHQVIEAKNSGTIELATTQGTLRLDGGSSMDVSVTSLDGRLLAWLGQINLNASRGTIGTSQTAGDETSGDIKIDASGPLNISGAQSIAVNGFWIYSPTDQYGTIVQDNGEGAAGSPVSSTTGYLGLDQVDARSQTFVANALANTGLQGRLAGLKTYTDAFHLRPGVEIDGKPVNSTDSSGNPIVINPNGDLTVAGDIDLSDFRYTSLNPNSQKDAGIYGSGEPGALVIRAGGNLDIVGSISDGFAAAPRTPDDNSWVLLPGALSNSVETLLPITLNSGTSFPNTAGLSLRYDIQIDGATIKANTVIPLQVTLSTDFTVPAGTRLAAPIFASDGTTVLFAAGTVFNAATVIPANSQLGAGSVMPGSVNIAGMIWTAGTSLGVFNNPVTLSADATVPFEGIIPGGTNVQISGASVPTRPTDASSNTQGSIAAIAPMLPAGDLSWSLRLVSGADLDAADTRIVKPASTLKASGVSGNLTLVDTHFGFKAGSTTQTKIYSLTYIYYSAYYHRSYPLTIRGISPTDPRCVAQGGCSYTVYSRTTPAKILTNSTPSVLRTGTGDLDLIAGGSFNEQSLFGVYTAGTQSQSIAADGSASGVNNPFNLPRGLNGDGTLLGTTNTDKAAAASAAYQAWYPEHGGNLLLSAQGNVSGYIAPANQNNNVSFDSDAIGQWLWRQGGAIAGQQTAWWINFGTYALQSSNASVPVVTGFQGIGTLGGGNLTVVAGGDAGTLGGNSGLDLAVASTGRVLADGSIVQTGGGDLTVRIGGALNPTTFSGVQPDIYGALTDLRGDISIRAGSVGVIIPAFNNKVVDPSDPRAVDYRTIESIQDLGGPTVAPGDGTVTIATRGDLVLGGASDAGMVRVANVNGVQTASGASGGVTSFTLWTPDTAINLYSAGGNLSPGTTASDGFGQNNGIGLYPGTLIAAAASGNLYVSAANSSGVPVPIELMPSPVGQLELLAAGSMYGGGASIAMSGAAMNSLATPLNPVFTFGFGSGQITNASPNSAFQSATSDTLSPIAFGPDTPTTNLHGDDSQPALIYAGGDIVNVQIGFIDNTVANPGGNFVPAPTTWYIGAKPFRIIAGRDIVGGTPQTSASPPSINFIFNDNPDDISLVHAGRDIIYDSVTIGGPGVLDVQAGRNLYQGYLGSFESIGPLVNVDPSNRSSGASISVTAGVGANGPDYTDFAKLYFDPANQLPADTPLAGSGKVVETYDGDLYTWLTQRFSPDQHYMLNGKSYVFTGSKNDALAFFLTLPAEQQGVFVRQVYFEELTAGGREDTGALASPRLGSYLRGRDAIAALFPSEDANGNPITYSGGITMFSGKVSYNRNSGVPDSVFNPNDIVKQFDAGIRTDFGGDIQILTPGGETITGVEGLAPGSAAGILTQGSGDIDIYSLESILLGQTRIMTTFGGDILAWSAEGDINAGRGSKTTVLFTPPRRVYDSYGNITLSPTVPSSGAGIATLNPIPQVPAGNIDLIAPFGTIDAGEAGIRVSGNINLAALQIVNAANIQVQGTTTGIPTVQAPNISTALSTSNATAATQQTALPAQNGNNDRPSIIIVEVLGYGGGSGDEAPQQQQPQDDKGRKKPDRQGSYDPDAPVRVVSYGRASIADTQGLTEEEKSKLSQP